MQIKPLRAMMALGLVAFFVLCQRCVGEEMSAKSKPVNILTPGEYPKFLTVFKERLIFVQAGEGGPAKRGGSDLPLRELSSCFVFEKSSFLRVRVTPSEGHKKSSLSKELLEKDGWYVTADYSKKSPELILTEKPSESSKWTLVPTGSTPEQRDCFFLRNMSGDGKAYWLGLESDAKTTNKGYVRMPVLSPDKTTYFRVVHDDTDGSR